MFKVGEIVNVDGVNKISFIRSFTDRIDDYGEINDCMLENEKKGITMPETGEFEIINYASTIKECHKKKEKWICEFCEEERSGPECESCNVSRAESESFQIKSNLTRESTTSTKTTVTLLDFDDSDEEDTDED